MEATSENLLVEGDAAMALEVLDAPYREQVKLCYIDPPFNTGKRFTGYRDRYDDDAWAHMLDRCLRLTRPLLRVDGSIWLHIDEAHAHYARNVLDAIFGPENFVTTVVWEKKRKGSYLHAQIACVTDRIIIYARDRACLGPFLSGETADPRPTPLHQREGAKRQILTFPAGGVTIDLPDGLVEAGDHSSASTETWLLDDVEVRDGRNVDAFRMDGWWRCNQDGLDTDLAEGAALSIAGVPFRPRRTRADSRPKKLTNLWSHRIDGCPTNEDGTAELKALGLQGRFGTPKPEGLLQRIIEACTDPGDLVLDYFAGSGTTPAVAHRLGRRWIAVEREHDTVTGCIVQRLEAVISGSWPPTEANTHPGVACKPRDLSAARRFIGALQAAGGFDDCDPDAVEKMLAALVVTRPTDAWHGGGSYRVIELGRSAA